MDVQIEFSHQKGVSLIEVMIAFFVLSVGLLGVAGLQLSSLRDNNSALLRTRAIVLVGDMMDRIRANAAGLADYNVGLTGDGVDNDCHTTNTVIASPCTPSQMAQHDVFEWKRLLSDLDTSGVEPVTGLPGANARITVADDASVTGLRTVTVNINWVEGNDTPSFSATTQIWP